MWQSGDGTNILYFTNGLEGTPSASPTVDGIRYYDGTTSTTVTVPFNPELTTVAGDRILIGSKLMFTIGQRLIVLNTYEYTKAPLSTKNYPQRARWCSKQNPSNWNDIVPGGGGYADAATGEQIISARQMQNQIIVFFTNSVWSLQPTADPHRAFQWKKLNNFRACDGKMASVAYDQYVAALGVRGITATNGSETQRIDERISDFTVNEINTDVFKKTFCERNYANKKWWTLYNNKDVSSDENNSALIFDEDSKAFSTYSINMNCLGYGNLDKDYSFNEFTVANGFDFAFGDYTDETFFEYFFQKDQELFLGGSVDGTVFIMDTGENDNGENIESEFMTAAWNGIKESIVETRLKYVDIYVETNVTTTANLYFYKDSDTNYYVSEKLNFIPNLGEIASIINIQKLNPVQITASEHGLTTGDIVYIYGVVGMTEINSGETSTAYTVTVVDENNITLNGIDATSFTTYSSSGIICSKKMHSDKAWKRVYAGGIGFQHRMKFISSGTNSYFKIHAMLPSFQQSGNRVVN